MKFRSTGIILDTTMINLDKQRPHFGVPTVQNRRANTPPSLAILSLDICQERILGVQAP
jgi:hypothetical protein